jgi:hypothetical protein
MVVLEPQSVQANERHQAKWYGPFNFVLRRVKMVHVLQLGPDKYVMNMCKHV